MTAYDDDLGGDSHDEPRYDPAKDTDRLGGDSHDEPRTPQYDPAKDTDRLGGDSHDEPRYDLAKDTDQDMTAYDDDLGNDEIKGQNAWMNKFYKNQGPEDPRATAKLGPTADEIKAYQNQTGPEADATASIKPEERPEREPGSMGQPTTNTDSDNFLQNNPQPSPHQSGEITGTELDNPAVSIVPGGTDAGTKGKTAGGSPHDTTSKLASISTDKIKDTSGPEIQSPTGSNVAGPKQDNTPQPGETLQSIAARLNYPSIQAFIDAQEKGSIGQMKSGSNLGNYFVKKGRQYKPFGENVVGLGRNINRLKVLAGI